MSGAVHQAPARRSSARKYEAIVGQRRDAIDLPGSEAVLSLDGRGMICDCNRAGERLFKYGRSDLVWRTVAMLLPELADVELIQDGLPNQRLRYLCRIGRHFEAVTQTGERFPSELFLNLIDTRGHGRLSLIVRPVDTELCAQPGAQLIE